ncbi:hypothetical protein [Myxosarcina sp. GI1]|nr:hypothetical protein [Myxosarcina sp. GI1]
MPQIDPSVFEKKSHCSYIQCEATAIATSVNPSLLNSGSDTKTAEL